jgi:hypothetical protein
LRRIVYDSEDYVEGIRAFPGKTQAEVLGASSRSFARSLGLRDLEATAPERRKRHMGKRNSRKANPKPDETNQGESGTSRPKRNEYEKELRKLHVELVKPAVAAGWPAMHHPERPEANRRPE